ncbi:MAG: HAD-IA family hydrolase [Candidatus Hermodarchaeota archaeon]
MAMIKTLIFDLGGVYFTRGSHIAVERIIDIYDIKDQLHLREFFRDSYKKEGYLLRLGLITMEEFERRLISEFNIHEGNVHHIKYLWFGSYVPHYKMDLVIKRLKEMNLRLVIFSGNIKERIDFLDNRYQFLRFFDDYIFSYDYQKNKNDIEFYKILLEKINCEPTEAIFIDDEKKNIKIAESLGINGILYYYTEQLIDELNNYNIPIKL